MSRHSFLRFCQVLQWLKFKPTPTQTMAAFSLNLSTEKREKVTNDIKQKSSFEKVPSKWKKQKYLYNELVTELLWNSLAANFFEMILQFTPQSIEILSRLQIRNAVKLVRLLVSPSVRPPNCERSVVNILPFAKIKISPTSLQKNLKMRQTFQRACLQRPHAYTTDTVNTFAFRSFACHS